MTDISSSGACPASADPEVTAFYRSVLAALHEAGVAFLVGGAYALNRYTGIARYTKDLDVFVHRDGLDEALGVLADAGHRTAIPFPHWLAKVYGGPHQVDVIFSAGNGVAEVDALWFEHAVEDEILGVPVRLVPPEEMIWSKAFIMERERYDGADVAHLLRATGRQLDWPRLVRRFDPHWRVLLSHLVLFSFVYPSERTQVPAAVVRELMARLETDLASWGAVTERVCQGTLLSREQYLPDVVAWGYEDARLGPRGSLEPREIEAWTAAIASEAPPAADADPEPAPRASPIK